MATTESEERFIDPQDFFTKKLRSMARRLQGDKEYEGMEYPDDVSDLIGDGLYWWFSEENNAIQGFTSFLCRKFNSDWLEHVGKETMHPVYLCRNPLDAPGLTFITFAPPPDDIEIIHEFYFVAETKTALEDIINTLAQGPGKGTGFAVKRPEEQ